MYIEFEIFFKFEWVVEIVTGFEMMVVGRVLVYRFSFTGVLDVMLEILS